jgi:tRNA(Ser,Leu) C12 N-acetylase TAN1
MNNTERKIRNLERRIELLEEKFAPENFDRLIKAALTRDFNEFKKRLDPDHPFKDSLINNRLPVTKDPNKLNEQIDELVEKTLKKIKKKECDHSSVIGDGIPPLHTKCLVCGKKDVHLDKK